MNTQVTSGYLRREKALDESGVSFSDMAQDAQTLSDSPHLSFSS
jgi:hypothetical protein